MPLILIRHASAGDRNAWGGEDRARPLDDKGVRQARELVSRLAAYDIDEIHTSPAIRCVQTVEPLAATRGLALVLRAELAEERQALDGTALLGELAGYNVVICGHGGLDAPVLDAPKWKKAAAFVLDRDLRVVERI